jgi:hypothetical protein
MSDVENGDITATGNASSPNGGAPENEQSVEASVPDAVGVGNEEGVRREASNEASDMLVEKGGKTEDDGGEIAGIRPTDVFPIPSSPLTSVGLDASRVDIFELGNYTFGRKDTESRGQESRGVDGKAIASHREKRFLDRGMRRSVAAVLLVHAHGFPHILLLQSTGSEGFLLPGGRLRPGECEEVGLRRKLTAKLSPVGAEANPPTWEIGDQCELQLTRVEAGRSVLTAAQCLPR